MKKLLGLLSITVLLTSCSEDVTNINNTFNVEEVTVQLNAQSLVTEAKTGFSTTSTFSLDESYTHLLPSSYTAYFVADETKGQWTIGDVVKSVEVVEGMNDITIPKMKVRVYVTNYDKPDNDEMNYNAWYTWSDSMSQLPQTSDELLLLGSNSIDYSVVTEGEVEMTNPYAAVMIKDNQWVNGSPKSFDTNQYYFLDEPSNWYVLYIRNNNTNTEIPISIIGNPNTTYTLSRTIEANKVYQYTINGNVLEDDGNLNVIVNPLEVGYAETIDL